MFVCDRIFCTSQAYNSGCETDVCNDKNQLECCYEMERDVNQILWNNFFGSKFDYEVFTSEVFIIKPYSWDEGDENSWNFYHIPSGLKVQWYKYPLRSPMCNMEITHEQFLDVLKDCYNYLSSKDNIGVLYGFHKWW